MAAGKFSSTRKNSSLCADGLGSRFLVPVAVAIRIPVASEVARDNAASDFCRYVKRARLLRSPASDSGKALRLGTRSILVVVFIGAMNRVHSESVDRTS